MEQIIWVGKINGEHFSGLSRPAVCDEKEKYVHIYPSSRYAQNYNIVLMLKPIRCWVPEMAEQMWICRDWDTVFEVLLRGREREHKRESKGELRWGDESDTKRRRTMMIGRLSLVKWGVFWVADTLLCYLWPRLAKWNYGQISNV